MKPATTLKELLKPPFERNGRSIYDGAGWLLAVLETFGRGLVVEQDKTNVAGDFVVTALNEKWGRDFGNPLQWLLDSDYAGRGSFICPYCRAEYCFDGELPDWENYSYCPHCGKPLKPAKEAHDE